MEHKRILQLTQCALIAALAYVGFQFLRIDIPVGTERTAIHLGNTFVERISHQCAEDLPAEAGHRAHCHPGFAEVLSY